MGQGVELLDLRAFSPGDDVRNVDWRASARRGELQVRRFMAESGGDWNICIDVSSSMSFGDKWLRTRQLAAAAIYALLYTGHRVALLLFSSEVEGYCPYARGRRQFARLVEAMQRQSATLLHGMGDVHPTRLKGELCRVLSQVTFER